MGRIVGAGGRAVTAAPDKPEFARPPSRLMLDDCQAAAALGHCEIGLRRTRTTGNLSDSPRAPFDFGASTEPESLGANANGWVVRPAR